MNHLLNSIIISFLLLLLFSCKRSIDTTHIKQHSWKYGDGYHVGDWISFETKLYKIQNDTLYKRDTARATIFSLDLNQFHSDNEMRLKSLGTGEVGTYHEK